MSNSEREPCIQRLDNLREQVDDLLTGLSREALNRYPLAASRILKQINGV